MSAASPLPVSGTAPAHIAAATTAGAQLLSEAWEVLGEAREYAFWGKPEVSRLLAGVALAKHRLGRRLRLEGRQRMAAP